MAKQWLLKRLSEKSTYAGIALLLSAFGVVVEPALVGQIAAGVVALVGLVDVLRDEEKEEKGGSAGGG